MRRGFRSHAGRLLLKLEAILVCDVAWRIGELGYWLKEPDQDDEQEFDDTPEADIETHV